MAKVTNFPNKSPTATTKMYVNGRASQYPSPKGGGWVAVKLSPDKPANANVPRATREAAIRSKYPANPGRVLNSGKAAYGPKPASFAQSASNAAARGAGAVARGALRAAGPVGALVGMTTPAGEGSDRPAGPRMKGNAEQMRGARVGPTQAPNRTAQSTASPPKGRSSYGGGGRDSGRSSYEGSGARSSGVASRPTSSGKSSYGGGGRDSGGVSKSAPARGTERFAKGSLVKSKVNQAGTYTKPGMRKKLFESVKASAVQGTRAGQWSARKAQLLAKKYKAAGGGYK